MNPKAFWQSKSFWLAIAWAIFGILRSQGILHVDDATFDNIIAIAGNLGLGVGTVASRAVAQGPLTMTAPPPTIAGPPRG